MPEKPTQFKARATFQGASGSLGYITDTAYRLTLSQPGCGAIIIQRLDGSGQKRYRSLPHFLASWSYLELLP